MAAGAVLVALGVVAAVNTIAVRVFVFGRRRSLPYWSEAAWKCAFSLLLILQAMLIGIAAAL
jgi:hypothetical protein